MFEWIGFIMTGVAHGLFFAAGLWIGVWSVHSEWRNNADKNQRLVSDKQFYKVVRLDDEWSWSCLDLHKGDRPNGVERDG